MADVYLETSFVSACVSTRTDAGSVYRRDVSLRWWETQRGDHALFVSAEVLAELSHARYPRRREAQDRVRDVPLLEVTDEVIGLASLFVREQVMPGPARGDAVHIAVACFHAMDYLLTWNTHHLANPNKLTHLRVICLRAGLTLPQIVTPDLLWEPKDEPTEPI